MLVAAMLFTVGWLVGRSYTMLILLLTSPVILFTALIVFATVHRLDRLHVIITLGYLAAHQSGYLLGAYCGGDQENSRHGGRPSPPPD